MYRALVLALRSALEHQQAANLRSRAHTHKRTKTGQCKARRCIAAAHRPAPCPRVNASSNTGQPDPSLCANASRALAGFSKTRFCSPFDSCQRFVHKRCGPIWLEKSCVPGAEMDLAWPQRVRSMRVARRAMPGCGPGSVFKMAPRRCVQGSACSGATAPPGTWPSAWQWSQYGGRGQGLRRWWASRATC